MTTIKAKINIFQRFPKPGCRTITRTVRLNKPDARVGTVRYGRKVRAVKFRLVRIVTRKLWPQDARACTRYHGVNVGTGRDVIIKSRGKIYEAI